MRVQSISERTIESRCVLCCIGLDEYNEYNNDDDDVMMIREYTDDDDDNERVQR